MKGDPHELKDLANDAGQGERVLGLGTALIAWLKQHGDPLVAPVLAP